jgi:hypothetical protein
VGLGQAVDGLAQQLGRLVRLVVRLVARAVEPEVGRQIDDLEPTLAQRAHGRRRRLVRVRDERSLGARRDRVRVELLELERDAVVRVQLVVRHPDVGAPGHCGELERRVRMHDRRGQGSGVAGRADDCDPRHSRTPAFLKTRCLAPSLGSIATGVSRARTDANTT